MTANATDITSTNIKMIRLLLYSTIIGFCALIGGIGGGIGVALYCNEYYFKPEIKKQKEIIINQIRTPAPKDNEKRIDELLDKADSYYNVQFSKLLTVFGIILAIFGVAAPLLLTIVQFFSLKEDRDKIDKATEGLTALQKKEEELSQKIEEQKTELTDKFKEMKREFYCEMSNTTYSLLIDDNISPIIFSQNALIYAIKGEDHYLIDKCVSETIQQTNKITAALKSKNKVIESLSSRLKIRNVFSESNLQRYPKLKDLKDLLDH